MNGGRSADGRYELRITQDLRRSPSDYRVAIHSAEAGRPLLTVDDIGGFDTFPSTACHAVWHASSRFVAFCDRGTMHSLELYIIGSSGGDRFQRLRVPDYVQNALGRMSATETELYCQSYPRRWDGDDLLVSLYFAVPNPGPEHGRLFYSCDVVLSLQGTPNAMPCMKIKSVTPPQPAAPSPEGSEQVR